MDGYSPAQCNPWRVEHPHINLAGKSAPTSKHPPRFAGRRFAAPKCDSHAQAFTYTRRARITAVFPPWLRSSQRAFGSGIRIQWAVSIKKMRLSTAHFFYAQADGESALSSLTFATCGRRARLRCHSAETGRTPVQCFAIAHHARLPTSWKMSDGKTLRFAFAQSSCFAVLRIARVNGVSCITCD